MLDPKLQAFLDFYNSLSANGLDAIADYYAEQVQFIDPVHEINSRSALQHYLAHGYQRLNYARFTPVSGLCQGERGFLSWQMRFSHPAFAKGEDTGAVVHHIAVPVIDVAAIRAQIISP